MRLKTWILKKTVMGKLPKFVYRFIGKKISEKLDLKENQMETKKWYLSKTILSNVVVFLLGIYAVAQTSLAPSFGWNLPNVPDWILSILAAIGIYGRVNAKTKIG